MQPCPAGRFDPYGHGGRRSRAAPAVPGTGEVPRGVAQSGYEESR